jgi:hypothetical protein
MVEQIRLILILNSHNMTKFINNLKLSQVKMDLRSHNLLLIKLWNNM